MSQDTIEQCAKHILEANSIAALTGAGISTNAGIPDFRGPQGLYVTRQYDPEKVFDIQYFYKDPKPFFEFARDFIELEKTIEPTITHQFLAKLEDQGKLKGIVTQNIDSLHKRAGSKNVFEMHGSCWQSFCFNCQEPFSYEQMKIKLQEEEVPHCDCGGVIKPDIVFFGESVKYFSEATHLASSVDLFLIIGTSCVVYPAASIPDCVNGKVIVINLDPIQISLDNIVLTINEDTDSVFQRLSEEIGDFV